METFNFNEMFDPDYYYKCFQYPVIRLIGTIVSFFILASCPVPTIVDV